MARKSKIFCPECGKITLHEIITSEGREQTKCLLCKSLKQKQDAANWAKQTRSSMDLAMKTVEEEREKYHTPFY